MKILASLSLALLLAMGAQGQKLSEVTWQINGSYSCPVGKVCRTPTPKEINQHAFDGNIAFASSADINFTYFSVGPCLSTWTYAAKTNSCSMNFVFQMPDDDQISCSPIAKSDDPTWSQSMKCSYTPKAKP